MSRHRIVKADRDDLAAQDGWFSRDGLRLHYVQWGCDEGAPIVLLHGLRSYAQTWEPVARPLAGCLRLIALDQRGRGLSDWDTGREYHTDAYVRDLEALVDHLGLRRFVLVGHSMGGANALVYAARHPRRIAGLVIEDMGPGASAASDGAERIKRELRATPSSFDSWPDARAFWRRQRPLISEAALDSRVRHSLRVLSDGRIGWRHDAEGITAARLAATPERQIDLWPHVAAITAPVLLIRGGESDFLSDTVARAMQERNPQIRAHVVPGASHYVHDDQIDLFNQCVGVWIASLKDAAWRPDPAAPDRPRPSESHPSA